MMNIFLVFILSGLLGGETNEISKKTGSHEQEPSSNVLTNARATSVYVSGDDVYVVGYQHHEKSKTVAKLWKNGIEQDVSDGTNHAFALSVFVSGSDVYVAGYESYDSPFLEFASGSIIRSSAAKLWKNGVVQNLSSKETKYAIANSVFVSGGDVYIAGSEVESNGQDSTFLVAKLWRNGVAQDISDSCGGIAQSVFVSGNDVYVAGSGEYECPSNPVAKLWKNGVAQNLSDETKSAWVHSVYVCGNDVYAAGVEYQERSHNILKGETAVLWKNGIAQTLSEINTDASSVFVSGDNIYVAGTEYGSRNVPYARFWENGQMQNINEGSYSRALAVYGSDNDVYVAGYERI